MADIIQLFDKNKENYIYPPDEVLERAKGEFKEVLILGYDEEGMFKIFTNGAMTKNEVLWIIKKLEQRLLEQNR